MSDPTQPGVSKPTTRQTIVFAIATVGVLVAAIVGGRWLRLRSVRPVISSLQTANAISGTTATPRIDRGEIVFQMHCTKCHGPDGHGDPDAIGRQKPPPRDFAVRPWRFEVSLDSIRNVTQNGIPSTAMPAHRAAASADDLDAVAAHTFRLATTGPIVEAKQSPLEAALRKAGFFPEPTLRIAPELALTDAAGNKRNLADERGRVVLLHFWGATCEHCLVGMPKLEQLADHWREQGLTVFNVCADADSVESSQALIDRVAPQSHTWVDASGLANSQFEVQALPTLWLVNRSGHLIGCARGMKDWESPEMGGLISTVLNSKAELSEEKR